MSERTLATLILIASIYGGVWSCIEKQGLLPIFIFLIFLSFWTVLNLWDQPEFDESD